MNIPKKTLIEHVLENPRNAEVFTTLSKVLEHTGKSSQNLHKMIDNLPSVLKFALLHPTMLTSSEKVIASQLIENALSVQDGQNGDMFQNLLLVHNIAHHKTPIAYLPDSYRPSKVPESFKPEISVPSMMISSESLGEIELLSQETIPIGSMLFSISRDITDAGGCTTTSISVIPKDVEQSVISVRCAAFDNESTEDSLKHAILENSELDTEDAQRLYNLSLKCINYVHGVCYDLHQGLFNERHVEPVKRVKSRNPFKRKAKLADSTQLKYVELIPQPVANNTPSRTYTNIKAPSKYSFIETLNLPPNSAAETKVFKAFAKMMKKKRIRDPQDPLLMRDIIEDFQRDPKAFADATSYKDYEAVRTQFNSLTTIHQQYGPVGYQEAQMNLAVRFNFSRIGSPVYCMTPKLQDLMDELHDPENLGFQSMPNSTFFVTAPEGFKLTKHSTQDLPETLGFYIAKSTLPNDPNEYFALYEVGKLENGEVTDAPHLLARKPNETISDAIDRTANMYKDGLRNQNEIPDFLAAMERRKDLFLIAQKFVHVMTVEHSKTKAHPAPKPPKNKKTRSDTKAPNVVYISLKAEKSVTKTSASLTQAEPVSRRKHEVRSHIRHYWVKNAEGIKELVPRRIKAYLRGKDNDEPTMRKPSVVSR